MAKAKFGKAEYADLIDMAENDEFPDASRVAHLLGKSQLLDEFDNDW